MAVLNKPNKNIEERSYEEDTDCCPVIACAGCGALRLQRKGMGIRWIDPYTLCKQRFRHDSVQARQP